MNEHIKKAILNGRLVLLLGAGASIGCKNTQSKSPPLGTDLANILAEAMGTECEDDDDLSDVYATSKDVLGEQLQKILDVNFKHCQPSQEYIELSKFPFFRIYTLNIDDGFENAVRKQNTTKLNIKQRFDRISEPDQFFQTLDLIKLNGDINYPSGGYIFSALEYARGSVDEPLWYSELAKDYHRYTFIFIGTKLKEPLFLHHVEKYKTKTASTDLRSYLLTPTISTIRKTALEASNIHHIPGKLIDFINWLNSEFPSPPQGVDILRNTRPELNIEVDLISQDRISLFSGVTPVSRASTSLIGDLDNNHQIKNFYKGFKPSWSDIVNEVPALLTKVGTYFNNHLSNNKPKPNELHLIFGSAGCGKTTALKQIAIKLADEGDRNVFFLEEYKDNFKELVKELNSRNSSPYYLIIERIGDIAPQLAEIMSSSFSDKAIFISSENPKIWQHRVKEHLGDHLKTNIDISTIENDDARLILDKIQKFGNWTRLSKMSAKNRRIELLKKAKRQLLIGLIETTSGEGYNEIIKNDYYRITDHSERALLILSGLATTKRVPAQEATLTRAMSYLGCNPNIHYVASNMHGIVSYENGKVSTRHRVYIERLFSLYVSKEDILKSIEAYLKAFSVYNFPIVKNISRNESSIYKHLVNAKSLKRLFNNDKEKVISIYKSFEKIFENEGLFLMQYGLALRSFDEQPEAYEKLRIAYDAFPESPHIEHALAQQRIILACAEMDENLAMAHFTEAEDALNRLHSSKINAFDRYPIITLSEGHVKLMVHLGKLPEAKLLAKNYHDRISGIKKLNRNERLEIALSNLRRFYVTGVWPDQNSDSDTDSDDYI
ncbi:cold-shock protein [Shewanella algae]|uniref:P-loop NTPase n=1 Tax=Shewanella algae TaxID=38313 RepID=UPI00118282A7|nr:SIR2 family protein [Shewanella algae]TVK99200.1 cold-shock protein [Shewanella algae]